MKPVTAIGPTFQGNFNGAAGAAAAVVSAAGAATGAADEVGAVAGAGAEAGVCATAVKAIVMTAPATICNLRFEAEVIGTIPPKKVFVIFAKNEFKPERDKKDCPRSGPIYPCAEPSQISGTHILWNPKGDFRTREPFRSFRINSSNARIK
jgi:hypothetical protein